MKKEINEIMQKVMINPGRTYSLIGKWLSSRCGEESYPEERLLSILTAYRQEGLRAPVGFFMYHIGKDIALWREETSKKQKQKGGITGVIKR